MRGINGRDQVAQEAFRTDVVRSHSVFRASHHELEKKTTAGLVDPAAGAPRTALARALDHTAVRGGVDVTILINAVQMGVAVDVRGGGWDETWEWFEAFFVAFFALETLLKLVALGLRYFREPWNIFDFFIVCSSLFDAAVSYLFETSIGDSAASIIRLCRLLRLLRVLKLLRVVPQFRILFDGILSTLQSMFWVGTLCSLLLYMVAVGCVILLGREDSGFPAFADDERSLLEETEAKDFNNYQYFGTVCRSLLSLFNLVVMAELDAISRPVWEVMPFITIWLVLFAFVMMFGVLNILVGMIMDNVMKTVRQMDRETGKRKRLWRASLANEISDILFRFDADGDGKISQEEFFDKSNSARLRELLTELHLPHGFTEQDLFAVLDHHAHKSMTFDEFSDGIVGIVMNGDAQRDVVLQARIAGVKSDVLDLRQSLCQKLSELHASLTEELGSLASQAVAAGSNGAGNDQDRPSGQRKLEQKLQDNREVHEKESQTEARKTDSPNTVVVEAPVILLAPPAMGGHGTLAGGQETGTLIAAQASVSTGEVLSNGEILVSCEADACALPLQLEKLLEPVANLAVRVATLEERDVVDLPMMAYELGEHSARISASEVALREHREETEWRFQAVHATLDSRMDELRTTLVDAGRPLQPTTLNPRVQTRHDLLARAAHADRPSSKPFEVLVHDAATRMQAAAHPLQTALDPSGGMVRVGSV